MQKIVFGAGCFWGVEHAFKQIDGVTNTRCGYQGGHTENPTYKEVCTKNTGHAEVVEVSYDETKVTLEQLLDAFWIMHDPTEVNRQGPDVGPQYRSVIFCSNEEEVAIAVTSKERVSSRFTRPISTQVEVNTKFWEAELNHQDYLENTPGGYCHIGFDVFQRLKSGNF